MEPPTWHFVPEDLDAGTLDALEPLFRDLLERPIENSIALRRWLADESELSARITAEKARRYIRTTCYTDDIEARRRFLDFEQHVLPRVHVLSDQLDQRFLASPHRAALDPVEFGVIVRQRQADREIFREANTLLQAEESTLQTRQQALMGGVVVMFEDREHTPQQMAPYYQEQDRERRRTAFEASLAARRPTWPELESIFDELVGLRTKVARNAGFETYTPFRFRQLHRFDYSEDLCREFHAAVESTVVPAVRRLNEERRRALGVDTLRPYDLDVDPAGAVPFRPFTTEEGLTSLVRQVFAAVDQRFETAFSILQREELLDLMSRKGKAPGGYQYQLEDVRLPFIFCNSVGTHQDVQTLLHEGGHAFHSMLSRHHDLVAHRHAPIEFAETASMSMELMGLEELPRVYAPEEARRIKRRHLEGLLRILPWIATIDAFQHWIYANPDHSREARRTEWLAIMDRFDPDLDHAGIEDARTFRWTLQPHLFSHPFYYIEYGIAQIAALQVWKAYRVDPQRAVTAYREGLALGGSRPLPELFEATGVSFDVSAPMLSGLVDDIEDQMREAGRGAGPA